MEVVHCRIRHFDLISSHKCLPPSMHRKSTFCYPISLVKNVEYLPILSPLFQKLLYAAVVVGLVFPPKQADAVLPL